MNYWTKLSVELAQQGNYLDELYNVYPITPNLRRELPDEKVKSITEAFESGDGVRLVKQLLQLELFTIKDSYVPYLKKDKTAIDRNPNTVNRIAQNLFKIGLEEIIKRCEEPK